MIGNEPQMNHLDEFNPVKAQGASNLHRNIGKKQLNTLQKESLSLLDRNKKANNDINSIQSINANKD